MATIIVVAPAGGCEQRSARSTPMVAARAPATAPTRGQVTTAERLLGSPASPKSAKSPHPIPAPRAWPTRTLRGAARGDVGSAKIR